MKVILKLSVISLLGVMLSSCGPKNPPVPPTPPPPPGPSYTIQLEWSNVRGACV